MTKFKNILIPILIALFVLSACSTLKEELGLSDKAGLTYNNKQLSEKDIDADIKSLEDNKPLVKQFESSQTPFLVKGKLSPDFTAAWLNIQLQILSIKEAREAAKLKVTKTDKTKGEEQAKSLFAGQDDATTKKIWDGFSKNFRTRLVNAFAEQEAFNRGMPKPTEKQIKTYFAKQACASKIDVSHILVADETAAKQIKKELDAGGDFAAIAKEKSTDTGSGAQGGELGCFVEGSYVPEFEAGIKALKVGDTSGPIKSQYGFHIIRTKAFVTPKLADVKDQIIAALEKDSQSAAYKKIEDKMKKAKVKVSKKYGKVERKDGTPSIVANTKKTDTSTGQDPTVQDPNGASGQNPPVQESTPTTVAK